MPKKFYLDERDRDLIQDAIRKLRAPKILPRGAVDPVSIYDQAQSPDVHVAWVPGQGIPGRSGTTIYWAECQMYEILDSVEAGGAEGEPSTVMLTNDLAYRVHNVSMDGIPGGQLIPVVKDKFGKWVALNSTDLNQYGTGTGTGTDETLNLAGATLVRNPTSASPWTYIRKEISSHETYEIPSRDFLAVSFYRIGGGGGDAGDEKVKLPANPSVGWEVRYVHEDSRIFWNVDGNGNKVCGSAAVLSLVYASPPYSSDTAHFVFWGADAGWCPVDFERGVVA